MRLQHRPFRFRLRQPLQTAAGVLEERRGWLLRLDDDNGHLGWGEVAPLAADQLALCSVQLERLQQASSRQQLEEALSGSPAALAFGLRPGGGPGGTGWPGGLAGSALGTSTSTGLVAALR